MEKIFLIRLIATGIKWLASITKNKVDDNIVNTIYNIITGSPEFISDVERILKFGKKGVKELRKEYKDNHSKTEVLKVVYKLVSKAPTKEVERVVNIARKELKKNAKL